MRAKIKEQELESSLLSNLADPFNTALFWGQNWTARAYCTVPWHLLWQMGDGWNVSSHDFSHQLSEWWAIYHHANTVNQFQAVKAMSHDVTFSFHTLQYCEKLKTLLCQLMKQHFGAFQVAKGGGGGGTLHAWLFLQLACKVVWQVGESCVLHDRLIGFKHTDLHLQITCRCSWSILSQRKWDPLDHTLALGSFGSAVRLFWDCHTGRLPSFPSNTHQYTAGRSRGIRFYVLWKHMRMPT